MASPAPAPRWHLGRVDSTNSWLARRCHADPTTPPGAVVRAAEQTNGRGKDGRTWVDRPGATLMFSQLLAVSTERLRWVTPLAGVALLRACETVLAEAGWDGPPLALKWPNDLLVGGRKAGGILTEHVRLTGPDSHLVIVGIGVNITAVPDPVRDRAAALWPAGGDPRAGAAQTCADRICDTVCATLPELITYCPDPAAAYRPYLWGVGCEVTVATPGARPWTGRIVGVDDAAQLLVTPDPASAPIPLHTATITIQNTP